MPIHHPLRSHSHTFPADSWPDGAISAADRERFARYAEARAFFEGAQWEGRRRPGELRMTFNYARTLIRKVSSYVFPEAVTFAVPDEGDVEAANRAEMALHHVLSDNELAKIDFDLSVEAAVLGDAAVKVTWDENRKTPVVAAVDPGTLTAETAPDDSRRLLSIAQRYRLPGRRIELIAGTQRGIAGIDLDRDYVVTEIWSHDHWQVFLERDEIRLEPNPFGFIPYVVIANNPDPYSFWGRSDLDDLYDVCRELNARMSVLSQILRLSGAPIVVLENVDGSDNITVGPGAKWELPGDAKAYLLDLLGNGGTRLHIDYIDLLYRTLHDLSETPRTAFGDSGRTLSGAALEVEIQPLVQKVARKRRQWEGFYQERNARILSLLEQFAGFDLGGLRRTSAIWPGVLPSDRDSAVRNIVALVEAGITSRRSAIAELGGLDPESELERIKRETSLLSS